MPGAPRGSPAFQEEVLVVADVLPVLDAKPGGHQPVASLVPPSAQIVGSREVLQSQDPGGDPGACARLGRACRRTGPLR